MRKMKLDVETLNVDSFGTEAEESASGGTVQGRQQLISHDGMDCQTYEGGTSCVSGGRLCVCACDPTPNCV